MAGIYIHIPFCHHKCLYCDFYSTGKSKLTDDFPSLILKEVGLRKNFIPEEKVETIYFGGGTPSLLSFIQIQEILTGINRNFAIEPNPEITIEVNPDDLSKDILRGYKSIGINRISVGVQSFIDDELKFLGRRHDANKAIESILDIYNTGFANVSVDLIYGIPNSSLESWEYSVNKAIELNVQHLSCYHLTFEESTPLTRKLKKGFINALDEELSIKQFQILREKTNANGFIHYEISNFAKEGFISKHNSSYWHGVPYLGVGPSAHSFNGKMRQWNVSSLDQWSNEIKQSKCTVQSETIDDTTKFNELLLTRLRTIWGVDLNFVAHTFPKKYSDYLRSSISEHLKKGNLIIVDESKLIIPPDKYFVSDAIIEDLFYLE